MGFGRRPDRLALAAATLVRQTLGCYGAGSLANTVLPGGVGDALRIELFARATGTSARWLCGGVCAGINAGRGIVFSALLLGAAAGGLVPGKLLLAPLAGFVAVGVAVAITRRRGGKRLGAIARGASSLTPSAIGWLALVLALRFGAAVYLLHSFSVASPVTAAVALLAALGASSLVPVTPGNVGVASAAVAVALAHVGVEPGCAVAVGIAYHGLETGAGLAFGAFGCALRLGSALPVQQRAQLGDLAFERGDAVLQRAPRPGRLRSWLALFRAEQLRPPVFLLPRPPADPPDELPAGERLEGAFDLLG